METLQIKKDDALKAHENATAKGKNLLENLLGKNLFIKNIRERIQTEEDIFELNNTTREEFEKKWKGFASHEIGNAMEILIAAAYNPDGLPDFTDDTRKYYAIFNMGSPSGVGFSYHDHDYWSTNSDVGSRLVFFGPDAYENLLDATTKFLHVYKQSRTT